MADRDDNFLDRVAELADEIGLTGRDKEEYIGRHAKAKGYRGVTNWVKDSGDDGSSGFFGSGGRDGGRDRNRDRDRDGDSGWFR